MCLFAATVQFSTIHYTSPLPFSEEGSVECLHAWRTKTAKLVQQKNAWMCLQIATWLTFTRENNLLRHIAVAVGTRGRPYLPAKTKNVSIHNLLSRLRWLLLLYLYEFIVGAKPLQILSDTNNSTCLIPHYQRINYERALTPGSTWGLSNHTQAALSSLISAIWYLLFDTCFYSHGCMLISSLRE